MPYIKYKLPQKTLISRNPAADFGSNFKIEVRFERQKTWMYFVAAMQSAKIPRTRWTFRTKIGVLKTSNSLSGRLCGEIDCSAT